MVKCTGVALHRDFTMHANDPFDLLSQLRKRKILPKDGEEKQYRMWIKVKSKVGDQTFWLDVCLASGESKIYNEAVKMVENSNLIETNIRQFGDNSPNTSSEKNSIETPKKKLVSSPVNNSLDLALSNITEATSEMTIYESFGSNSMDDVEPFTEMEIDDDELQLIALLFPKKKKGPNTSGVVGYDVVLVNLTTLITFVKTELNNATPIFRICIKDMQCRDGKKRSFTLSSHVWIGSMLEHSKNLRKIFSATTTAEKIRKDQLAELQGMQLLLKIKFWIADMFDFAKARTRLGCQMAGSDIAPYLSPHYFDECEARYLGGIMTPEGISFKECLKNIAEEQQGVAVCTTKNLAPKVLSIFDLKSGFLEDKAFQSQRTKWIKECKVLSRGSAWLSLIGRGPLASVQSKDPTS